MKLTNKLVTLAAVPLLALSAGPANAVPVVPHIFISDMGGVNYDWIYDGDTDDDALAAGEIAFIKNKFGGWSLAIAAGIGLPAQGNAAAPDVHLGVIGSSTGAADLFVAFFDASANGYTPGIKNWTAEGGGALGAGATIEWGVCAGVFAACDWSVTGVPINLVGLLGSMTTFGAMSGTMNQPVNYSSIIFAFLRHDRKAGSSLDMDFSVPEPGSLALLGLGLLGFAASRRRRGA